MFNCIKHNYILVLPEQCRQWNSLLHLTQNVFNFLVSNLTEVEIVGFGETKKSTVTGVEMFRKLLDQGQAGDNIGALLRGIDKKDIQRGQVLAKRGTIHPHTKFTANVYVLHHRRNR